MASTRNRAVPPSREQTFVTRILRERVVQLQRRRESDPFSEGMWAVSMEEQATPIENEEDNYLPYPDPITGAVTTMAAAFQTQEDVILPEKVDDIPIRELPAWLGFGVLLRNKLTPSTKVRVAGFDGIVGTVLLRFHNGPKAGGQFHVQLDKIDGVWEPIPQRQKTRFNRKDPI